MVQISAIDRMSAVFGGARIELLTSCVLVWFQFSVKLPFHPNNNMTPLVSLRCVFCEKSFYRSMIEQRPFNGL